MIKLKHIIKSSLLLVIMIFFYAFSIAQNITFNGSAKQTVRTGERFKLFYEINAKASEFSLPQINDFSVLSNVNQSSSSSFSFSGGKSTSSVTYTFYVILQAVNEGTFTISPATVTVKNKKYQSNSINVKVVKGSTQTQTQTTKSRTNQNTSNQNQSQSQNKNKLFVKSIISKPEVYQGEQLIITHKIYSRVNIMGLNNYKMPAYTGFWKEDIKTDSQINVTEEIINGARYTTGVFSNSVLLPQRSGDITIEPMAVDCIVREVVTNNNPRNVWDSFFNTYQDNTYTVKSNSLKIKVKPLPPNKPASFSGAVGNFNLASSISQQSIKSNEGINYKITISGKGNLKLIDKFNIEFPSDFEVYKPKITDNISVTNSGISGKRLFDYLIIPRHAGNFTLPPVEISYFDPEKKQYVTLTTNQFDITVEKGENEEVITNVTNINKEDIKYIGKDIRYIKTGETQFITKGVKFFGTLNFYLLYIIPSIIALIFIVLVRKRIKNHNDVSGLKHKRANKLAKTRLKIAQNHLKNANQDQFYEEISKAFWGYFSDKLSIPLSELSKETVISTLTTKNLDANIIAEFTELIEHCEFARFAPSGDDTEMSNIYSKSVDLMSNIERKIK